MSRRNALAIIEVGDNPSGDDIHRIRRILHTRMHHALRETHRRADSLESSEVDVRDALETLKRAVQSRNDQAELYNGSADRLNETFAAASVVREKLGDEAYQSQPGAV